MAQKVASLYAEIGADTSGLKRGLTEAKTGLEQVSAQTKKLSTTFNNDFLGGLNRGSASTKDFTKSLLDAGDKAGLGTSQLARMAEATGQFSDKQILAARASANVARKAEELTKAVASGTMTSREAGRAFTDFAKAQEVAAGKTAGMVGNLKSFAVTAGVAIGVITAFGVVAKAAFDFARAGAELEYTRQKFDRLAMSIGTTGDALQRDLKIATRGMISDSELVASATDLMALGLAKTHAEAVRLARVSGALGMNMNQLVLTLTNQTTMRFDALGVSVDGFTEKVDKLKAAGMDANTAFRTAFLQQAEEQLAKVGERADSTAGKYQHLETASKNLADVFKTQLAGAFDDAAEAAARFFDAISQNMNARAAVDEAERLGVITHDEAVMMQEKLRRGYMESSEALKFLDGVMGTTNARIEAQRAAWMGTAEAAAFYVDNVKQKFADLQTIVADPLGEQLRAFQKEQQGIMTQRSEIFGNIAFLEQGGVNEDEAAKIAELKGQIGELNAAYQENANQYALRTKQVLFNMLLEKIAAADLTEAQLNQAYIMAQGVAKAWGIRGAETVKAIMGIDAAVGQLEKGNIQGAINKANELKNVFLGIQGDYYVNFKVSVTGADLSKLGVAGAAGAVNVIQPKAPKGFSGGGGGGKVGGVGASGATVQKKTRMQMLQETASALSSVGSAAQQIYETTVLGPLKQRLANLDALMTPGHIDLAVMDKSVQFMEERARAAQEVADAEKKVLELQKAQQRLALVEAQMRLLDLIKENKLNAKSILGDLKLGAGADMLGVIDATTRALDAIVGQMSGGAGGLAGGGSGGGGDLNWKRQVGLTPGTPEWDAASSMTFKEWKAKNGVKAASGFAGTIPGGFPNDTFPIWTSSGEHVLVTPPGEKGGASVYNINITMPLTNVTDMVDWERGAYRMSQILKRRLG